MPLLTNLHVAAYVHVVVSLPSAEHTEDDLKFLLDLVQNDPEPRIRWELLWGAQYKGL